MSQQMSQSNSSQSESEVIRSNWREHDRARQAQGLGVAEYCRLKGLKPKGLYNFRSKFLKSNKKMKKRRVLKTKPPNSTLKSQGLEAQNSQVASFTKARVVTKSRTTDSNSLQRRVRFHLSDAMIIECEIEAVGSVYRKLLEVNS